MTKLPANLPSDKIPTLVEAPAPEDGLERVRALAKAVDSEFLSHALETAPAPMRKGGEARHRVLVELGQSLLQAAYFASETPGLYEYEGTCARDFLRSVAAALGDVADAMAPEATRPAKAPAWWRSHRRAVKAAFDEADSSDNAELALLAVYLRSHGRESSYASRAGILALTIQCVAKALSKNAGAHHERAGTRDVFTCVEGRSIAAENKTMLGCLRVLQEALVVATNEERARLEREAKGGAT